MFPIPGVAVSTPYGRRGKHWSCDRNILGGVHTGVDFAAPVGTKIIAPIDGQIRHRNYGSAFGKHQFVISPDPGQPFEKGEVFFAHTRTRMKDGVYVKAGDVIAEVGAEGNVTGPHLHLEFHPTRKNVWNCSVHADPEPVLQHKMGGTGGGPYVTKNIYTNKLGFGEPTNGDKSSDTVKELQERLNRTSFPGSRKLPITGIYGEVTDEQVRLWQKHIGNTPDPVNRSYLGPLQTALMFASPPYTIHDRGLPKIASPDTPDTDFQFKDGTTLGAWLMGEGFKVRDTGVPIGRASTWKGVQFIMWHHTASPDTNLAASDARWIRSGNNDAPLAQLMVDQDGQVWICSYERDGQPDPGRASHAGNGKGFGVPDDKMNEVSLGIEFKCPGDKPISAYPEMYEVGLRLTALLRKRYEVPKEKVIGHKEWSSTGKQDPRDDMDVVREAVEAMMDSEVPVDPEPEPEPGLPLFQYRYSGKPSKPQEISPRGYSKITRSKYTPPGDGFLLVMQYVNAQHTFKSGVTSAGFRLRSVRHATATKPIDYSGYGDYTPNTAGTQSGTFLATHIWFEMCDGGRPIHWEINRSSKFATFTLSTRYTKWLWVSSAVFNALSVLAGGSKSRAVDILAQWLADAPEDDGAERTLNL